MLCVQDIPGIKISCMAVRIPKIPTPAHSQPWILLAPSCHTEAAFLPVSGYKRWVLKSKGCFLSHEEHSLHKSSFRDSALVAAPCLHPFFWKLRKTQSSAVLDIGLDLHLVSISWQKTKGRRDHRTREMWLKKKKFSPSELSLWFMLRAGWFLGFLCLSNTVLMLCGKRIFTAQLSRE